MTPEQKAALEAGGELAQRLVSAIGALESQPSPEAIVIAARLLRWTVPLEELHRRILEDEVDDSYSRFCLLGGGNS